MIALISDIHGNFEALSAVLEDIERRGGAETIYCLGDIVGYGPDPEACVDLIKERCKLHLMGNHDYAILHGAVGFNPIAKSAIDCQRMRMEPGEGSLPRKQERWQYIQNLQHWHEAGDFIFVHASPRDPLNEYILSTDVTYDPDKVMACFERVKRFCFIGHTHIPGVMTSEPRFLTLDDLGNEYVFRPNQKAIINIGSVGQPRDSDTRACYVEFDENLVRYHRVQYDYEKTIRKVKRNPCLDERCGTRLALGR